MSYSTIKTFIYDFSNNDLSNQKYFLPGVKKIQICNYGIHGDAVYRTLAEIDLGSLLPNTEKLYCHIEDNNNFLVHSSLEYDVSNIQVSGIFKPIVKNMLTGNLMASTNLKLVLQLNLIY